ncbi:unnamed protein product, partial [Didymodactylos carnosus]
GRSRRRRRQVPNYDNAGYDDNGYYNKPYVSNDVNYNFDSYGLNTMPQWYGSGVGNAGYNPTAYPNQIQGGAGLYYTGGTGTSGLGGWWNSRRNVAWNMNGPNARPFNAQPFNAQPFNAQPFNAQPFNAPRQRWWRR